MEILLKYYPVLIRILSMLLSAAIVILFYITLIHSERLKKSWERLHRQLNQEHVLRKEEIAKVKQLQGEAFQLPLTERLDVLIAYSGLQNKLPFLNGITYLFFNLLIVGGVIILGLMLSNINLTLITTATIILLPYLSMQLQANQHYEATKKEFPTFMRMISSFSKSYQDILTILDASASYVGSPIRDKVSIAVIKARANGDIRSAMKWLVDNIEYKLFKDLIRALEITSRHSLNYADIVDQFMVITEKKNASDEKQKVIVNKGRIGILVMLILGVAMFYMVIISINGSNSITEGILVLQATVIGKILLGYMACVFLGSMWYMIFKMKIKD